jgi:hypothetical protein
VLVAKGVFGSDLPEPLRVMSRQQVRLHAAQQRMAIMGMHGPMMACMHMPGTANLLWRAPVSRGAQSGQGRCSAAVAGGLLCSIPPLAAAMGVLSSAMLYPWWHQALWLCPGG